MQYNKQPTYYRKWQPNPQEVWYSIKADRLYVLKRGTIPPTWYTFLCNL